MAYEGIKTQMFRQTITSVSTEQKEALGTLRILDDGRKFRYCENGEVALVPGVCVMPPALEADHTDEACAAAVAVGAKSITITLGAEAVAADVYAGGFIQINDAAADADRGYQYKIATHPAADLSTDLIVYLDEPVVRAIPDTAELSLVHSRFKNVVVTTGITVVPSGITVCNVPASTATVRQYFWAQSGGEGVAIGDGNTAAIGTMICPGAAGVVRLAADTNSTIIGIARAGTIDTEATSVLLFLD